MTDPVPLLIQEKNKIKGVGTGISDTDLVFP